MMREQFLKDVAKHEMAVIRDEGVTRHLRFRRPDTWNQGFDLVTWSGHLCYTGDMGTYVFSRLPDMFEFFRQGVSTDDRTINPGYWSEKLLAVARNGGVKEFSEEKFRTTLTGIVADDPNFDEEKRQEVLEDLEESVLKYSCDGEDEARRHAEAFDVDEEQYFHDLWEYSFDDFTHHFLWCCHAIVWGISKYDAAKSEPEEDNVGGQVKG